VAILAAVGVEPAYVYGNSGGGTTGLELVARLLQNSLSDREPKAADRA
jgi:pimeloyl-ACP methyl ester carboxylesterase